MKKKIAIALVLLGIFGGLAEAQKSGGSRSSSGGSRSSGSRSYSSGSGRSTAPKSTPSTRSYSSGKSTTTPSGKSYSSGTSKSTAGSQSATSSTGKSYSSGNSSKPAVGTKPTGKSFDSKAAVAARKSESAAAYKAAVKPDVKSVQTQSLKSTLTPERYSTRAVRQNTFYSSYRNYPVVIYQDHYNPLLNAWLMTQTVDTMAHWIYHRQDMTAARREALIGSNAELRARIAALEASNIPVNPAYVPPGIDPDLVYSDEHIKAVSSTSFLTHVIHFLIAVVIIAVVMFLIAFIVAYIGVKSE